jgi:hypothetical protein
VSTATDDSSLFVRSNGNVGVGIQTPIAKLHLFKEHENNDLSVQWIDGNFKATSSGIYYNRGIRSVLRPSANTGVQNDGHAIGHYLTIWNNDPGDGRLADLIGQNIYYGIATGGGLTIDDARGLSIRSYRQGGGIVRNYDLFIDLPAGSVPVTNDWAIYSKHNAPSYFAGSIALGITSPAYKFDVVGDIHCTGKLTSDGGYDPPYVLYNSESRKSIEQVVLVEIPPDKLDGAVVFFNRESAKMEVFLPSKGEFKSFQGDVLATVKPITSTFEVEERYYFDARVGRVKKYQVRKVPDDRYRIMDDYELDSQTGSFYKVLRNENGEEKGRVNVRSEEAVQEVMVVNHQFQASDPK